MSRRSVTTASIVIALLVGVGAVAAVTPASAAKAVKKPAYKVSATASASSVRTSGTLTISGTVTPKSRATVTLQRYHAGAWRKVASKKLPKSSKYAFTTGVGGTATTLRYRVTKAKARKVKAGVSRTVVVEVRTWGTVKSWGYNTVGQLGTGSASTTPASSPIDVVGLTEVTKVVTNAAGDSAYALRRDGTVASWGNNNEEGKLGLGSLHGFDATPRTIPGLTGVTDIAAAADAAYALKSDGTVWSWGKNLNGELGIGRVGSSSATPGQVLGVTGARAIAGARNNGYAVTADGSVWSWGEDSRGQLGQGTSSPGFGTPGKLAGISGVTAIAAGGFGVAVVGSYGSVWTWGDNLDGQLGIGSTIGRTNVPVQVTGLGGVTRIGASSSSFYALAPGGVVWSWGSNLGGSLGAGPSVGPRSAIPVPVSDVAGVLDVAGSSDTGFAISASRELLAWGPNDTFHLGSVGSATPVPVTVPGLVGVTSVSGGARSAYAVIG